MYQFIFYFFYRYYQKHSDSIPKFRSVVGVASTHIIHLFCLYSILRYFGLISLSPSTSPWQKYSIVPLALVWLYLVYNYFSDQRIAVVLEEYDKKFSGSPGKKYLLLAAIFILPMMVGVVFMKLGNRS